MKIAQKLGTGLVTLALIGSFLAPAVFADTTVTKTDNSTLIVTQSNNLTVINDVTSTSNTGGNIGGNITTGSAHSSIVVTTIEGHNVVKIKSCPKKTIK